VTACDIAISDRLKGDGSGVRYVACNVQNLPFSDRSFDYVVSTHMLEHVQNLPKAVNELRRVAP
jgi:ubiquinone/menaquinone biosynthesis C-methylase UbiE